MRKFHVTLAMQAALAVVLLGQPISDAYARSGYGETVDNYCRTYNGTTPFVDAGGSCLFCHDASSKSIRVDPQWTWWQNQLNGGLANFCPANTNQAPDSTINSPANNATFNKGDSVTFSGSGSDPAPNLPLTYAWNFGGAAANANTADATVTLNTAGNFTVTFTVTDGLGRPDPSPATINITVVDPFANQAPDGTIVDPQANVSIDVGQSVLFRATANDPEGDSMTYFWNFGGGAGNLNVLNPGNVVFNTPGIFTVTFTATDVQGLADPTPATRVINVGNGGSACTDQDGDGYSPDGGACGPRDCNDFDPAVNPGAVEACNDGIDNDCNGDIDGNDAQCNGGNCLAELLKQVDIDTAYWKASEHELKVKGTWSTLGTLVELSDARTGEVLGTTRTEVDDDYPAGVYEWKFEFEHLTVVPCRVRVVIDGRYGERDVAYAPAGCSGTPPVTNREPVANDDNATTRPGESVKIPVLANDTDPDQDKLTIVVFTQPDHGVVTKDSNDLVYKADRRFTGRDRFSYTISDGHGGMDSADVYVSVQRTSDGDHH